MDPTSIESALRLVSVGATVLFLGSTFLTVARKMDGRPANWGLPAFCLLAAVGPLVIPIMMRFGEPVGEDTTGDEGPPLAGPAVEPFQSTAESVPEVWGISAIILAIIAGAAVTAVVMLAVAGVIFIRRKTTPHTVTPAQTEQDRASETARLWRGHVAALNELRQKYVDFETDPWSAFRRPLLADVAEPETAAFHDAFSHAQDLHTERRPRSRAEVDDFGAAVRAATRAWQVADMHARKVAVPTTSEAERRRLRQAKAALLLAMDANTSAPERRVALARVEELISGLTAIPAKARTTVVAELDTIERKAITS